MKSKVYFYGLGQTARTRGLTKEQGFVFYGIDSALPFASIYFDKGYRGLSL